MAGIIFVLIVVSALRDRPFEHGYFLKLAKGQLHSISDGATKVLSGSEYFLLIHDGKGGFVYLGRTKLKSYDMQISPISS